MSNSEPVFLYDFNSPYAYLAASRVDELLPVAPRWQPVALAFILRARDRSPWSVVPDTRAQGIVECEARAGRYGLPPLSWPPGWPVESYSLLPLRAALVAEQAGCLRDFSRAAFARNFVHGLGLRSPEDVLEVAEEVGLPGSSVVEQARADDIKERLRLVTEDAIVRGLNGVPTTVVGDQLFWGDDQLPAAAAALQQRRRTDRGRRRSDLGPREI